MKMTLRVRYDPCWGGCHGPSRFSDSNRESISPSLVRREVSTSLFKKAAIKADLCETFSLGTRY